MTDTRTVPLKITTEGRVLLAHPDASPGDISASGAVIAVGGVPAGISSGMVAARVAHLKVRWTLETAPEQRVLHWGAIADLPCGAVVRPEAGE